MLPEDFSIDGVDADNRTDDVVIKVKTDRGVKIRRENINDAPASAKIPFVVNVFVVTVTEGD